MNGKAIGACLGDLYSVNWMEDSDTQAGLSRTLDGQYGVVKKETNKSHVQEFGSVGTFDATEPVSDFQAHKTSLDSLISSFSASKTSSSNQGVVNARDIPLVTAFYKYLRNPSGDALKGLMSTIESREVADKMFPGLVSVVKSKNQILRDSKSPTEYYECKKSVYSAIEQYCGGFDDYSLKYSHDIIALCEDRNTLDVVKTIQNEC